MTDLTRRNFLKGFLALSASAFVPVELINEAVQTFDIVPSSKIPEHSIIINGQMIPFYELNISESLGNGDYIPYYDHEEGWMTWHTVPVPSRPQIKLFIDNKYYPLVKDLRAFDFEIIYKKASYSIKGKGYADSIDYYNVSIPSFQNEYITFSFSADIERYAHTIVSEALPDKEIEDAFDKMRPFFRKRK